MISLMLKGGPQILIQKIKPLNPISIWNIAAGAYDQEMSGMDQIAATIVSA